MSFFRADGHHTITKQMTIQIQYKAVIAGTDRITEVATRPWKEKNFPLDGYDRVQV
jgi:hypothetical protein